MSLVGAGGSVRLVGAGPREPLPHSDPRPETHWCSCPSRMHAQLLGVYPADKYSVSAEDVATRVGAVCAARPVDLRAV